MTDSTGLTQASPGSWHVGSGWMIEGGLTQVFGVYKPLGKGLVSSAHGLSPFSRLAWAHSQSNVEVPSAAGDTPNTQGLSKPQLATLLLMSHW